jgi:hypothetical protein
VPWRKEQRLTTGEIVILVFLVFYVPLISTIYGRQGRWIGAAGWSLLAIGTVALGIGLGSAFAWAGLLFLFLTALGLLLIISDIITRRRTLPPDER